jgi:hypothetical protein
MSSPTQYNKATNFITAASGPDGAKTLQQVATQLEAEFVAIESAMDSTQTSLALIQRNDGYLQNASVGVYQFSADALSLIASKSSTGFKGNWAASTNYSVGDSVAYSGVVYYCNTAHTSGASFDSTKFVATLVVSDNTVSTAKIQPNAVTAAKLATTLDLSTFTITLPPNVVAASNLATTLDLSSGITLTLPANVVQNGNIAATQITANKLSTGGPTWDTSGNLTATSFVGNASTATKFASAPAFSYYQSTTQTLASSTPTKINLQTKDFDTHNAFDNAITYQFKPTVAGYYQLNGALTVATSTSVMYAAIYKYNGTSSVVHKVGQNCAASTAAVSAVVYLNGSTDYVELWGFVTTGQALVAAIQSTYFNGVLVKPA